MKKCSICENPAKLVKNCKNNYNKTCGSKECKTQMKKITNIERYGHSCSLHGTNKEKNLELLKEKYGENITNISQLDSVKEKKMETCRKNFKLVEKILMLTIQCKVK